MNEQLREIAKAQLERKLRRKDIDEIGWLAAIYLALTEKRGGRPRKGEDAVQGEPGSAETPAG